MRAATSRENLEDALRILDADNADYILDALDAYLDARRDREREWVLLQLYQRQYNAPAPAAPADAPDAQPPCTCTGPAGSRHSPGCYWYTPVLPHEVGIPVYMARGIADGSWLNDDAYADFRKRYQYAATQTRAIPALAKLSAEEVYWLLECMERRS